MWNDRFSEDRDTLLNELGKDLKYIVDIGVDRKTSEQSVKLSYMNDYVYSVVGVHPHDAANMTEDDFEKITSLAYMDKVVAIGEVGLDYYRDLSPRDVQKIVFARFLNLAKSVKLPVVVHVRDAYDEAIDIIQTEGLSVERGVIHSFMSNYEDARTFLDMGMYLGIGGPLTFKKNHELRDTIKKVPIERIVTETDCPYLTPAPKRGHRNEPGFVRYVVDKIAEIKDLPKMDVQECLCENAVELFTLPKC